MAEELTAKDVIKAHARDELGIDLDDMTNPALAAVASMLSFLVGAGLPLLSAAFIQNHTSRLISLVLVSTAAMAFFGVTGALLGGANPLIGGARVLIGGWTALAITYGTCRSNCVPHAEADAILLFGQHNKCNANGAGIGRAFGGGQTTI